MKVRFRLFLPILTASALLAAPRPAPPARSAPGPELRFATGPFRPLDPPPALPSWYTGSPRPLSPKGLRYLVAIVRGDLTTAQREALSRAGATVLDYIPVHGYRLRLPPGSEESVRSLPFVEWLGETPPPAKLLGELTSQAGRPKGPIRLRVVLNAGEPATRVTEELAGLDGSAAPSGKDAAWRVEATVPAGRLATVLTRLVVLPEVEAIEPVRLMRLNNQDAVWVHQSFVGPSPQSTPIFDHGIFGCGQVVALSDSGQDYDACYFRDAAGAPPFYLCNGAPCPSGTPNPARRKDIIYYNWSGTPTGDDDFCPGFGGASGHGTHTSGSAAGDSSPFADCSGFTTPGRNGGDGLAPGAKLVIEEMGDGLEYLNNRNGTLWNLADVAYRSGARIHSNSWGGACQDAFGSCIPGCTLPYDSFARDADLAMWTYPDLLEVFSAGNAGGVCDAPDAVNTPAIAKSSIAAGSLGHGSNAGIVSSFSSPGPVFDGRLKPTLAAQGESVVSAASDANPATNNCSTCSLDGTSMAAPTTAGLAALVREYYAEGYYAAGARNPAQGFAPSAALVKATLIDGAVALGAAAPSPDFESGYGRLLLSGTLAFSGGAFRLRADDHREGIITGSAVRYAWDVAGGTPLRATLVWTDFPAALGAATARVNELKLELADPDGNVWFQTLDGATGAPVQTMNPAAAHDPINVEERLVFSNPVPGRWTARVIGVDVPMGPQPFALVVRGALSDCPAPAAPGPLTLSAPADHQVRISWDAVSGAAGYNVYRSLGSCPQTAWVPVATGVTGTSYLDTGVSGGAAYSYYVASASDPASFCESARSPCASIVPTGDCFLLPEFSGVALAASAGSSACAVNLSWNPATPRCGTDVLYNVYRGTAPGFAPDASHRIARCVSGAAYTDSADLLSGATYYYVVRAEDSTTGHGGPCRGGNEETNVTETSTAPYGPPVLGTWSDDAGDTGTAKLTPAPPWSVAATGGATGPRVYTAASAEGVCADLTTPTLTLGSPGLGPTMTFRTIHDLEYDPVGFFGAEGSLGQVEIATGPGFTNWTRLPLTPDYPALVEFPLNDCPTTQNIDNYFSGTNLTYTSYTASLVNWGSGEVKIRFHLSGDYLYPGGYWSIDDVSVSAALTPGVCATVSPGPPPIPDGSSVPGQPLAVSLSGADVSLTWDAASCPAAAVNVYYGSLGSYGQFTGGLCDLPATGSATVSLPDDVWFLVVATDGAHVDGSWSRDALGAELIYAGSSTVCPAITGHDTAGGCP